MPPRKKTKEENAPPRSVVQKLRGRRGSLDMMPNVPLDVILEVRLARCLEIRGLIFWRVDSRPPASTGYHQPLTDVQSFPCATPGSQERVHMEGGAEGAPGRPA